MRSGINTAIEQINYKRTQNILQTNDKATTNKLKRIAGIISGEKFTTIILYGRKKIPIFQAKPMIQALITGRQSPKPRKYP